MEEVQMAEEIVFVDWGKKECHEVTMADLEGPNQEEFEKLDKADQVEVLEGSKIDFNEESE